MFWLGLVLPVCFWAGYTGANIPTQWIVLSAVLACGLWLRAQVTAAHWFIAIFVLYAVLSIIWSAGQKDSVEGVWKIIICAEAFWLGSAAPSLRRLWIGLAIGLLLSWPIILAQIGGQSPVYFSPSPNPLAVPGLLFNTTVLGATAALVIVGLIESDLWALSGALMPLLWIAHSKGAWVALAAALICKYIHWALSAALVLTAGVAFFLTYGTSDLERIEIWHAAYQGLTIFGRGASSFGNVMLAHPTYFLKPEFVHNDSLQLLFEYGVGAIPLFLAVGWTLTRHRAENWPVFICFIVLGIFWFPLFSPIPAFIGCIVAGNLARRRVVVCDYGLDRRFISPAWLQKFGSENDFISERHFPVERRHP